MAVSENYTDGLSKDDNDDDDALSIPCADTSRKTTIVATQRGAGQQRAVQSLAYRTDESLIAIETLCIFLSFFILFF